METSLLDAVINFIGTNSPKGISEALGTIGKWGATEADYIAFLQSKGFTVLQGTNGQYTVYKVGECIAGNGNAAAVSTVFETTATEVTVESAQVTEVAATGTGAGLMGLDVGLAGAAIAPALGIVAGVALYNLTPDFWDGIAATLMGEGKLKDGKVPTLIDENGKTSFDQATIEIYKDAFLDAGFFEYTTVIPTSSDLNNVVSDSEIEAMQPIILNSGGVVSSRYPTVFYECPSPTITENETNVNNFYAASLIGDGGKCGGGTVSSGNFKSDGVSASRGTYSDAIGKDYYVANYSVVNLGGWAGPYRYIEPVNKFDDLNEFSNLFDKMFPVIAFTTTTPPEDAQEGATLPTTDPINITFPDWLPDVINNINWYPVSMPTDTNTQTSSQTGTNDNPLQDDLITDTIFNPSQIPGEQPQPDPDPQPEPEPEPQPEPTPQPDPINPNPEPDPSGNSPVIPPVSTTTVSSLFTVYNPTDAQLDSLGSFLWTTSIIEQIKKIWQNPIEGVISLHKVYSGVTTGSSKNIILGYVDSGVSALEVTSQFATVDCGSITVAENKHNATDYSPFTQLQLYLPFIGIQELDTNEIMNGSLHVVYKVDVYTGTCIALVYAQRSPDMPNEQLLYTFSGNASQKLPLTASDFGGAISALLGIVGVGVASGGALGVAAGALGVAHSLTSDMVHIQHSGGLSANSGILGPRKPFLIISRQYGYDANGYAGLYGYPANKTVYLSNCTGFTRVKNVIFKSAATDAEKQMIEAQLKEGIIL